MREDDGELTAEALPVVAETGDTVTALTGGFSIFVVQTAERANAAATERVKYVDANGKDMGAKDCLPVAENMTAGWYVSRTVTFENRIQVKGDVNLILKDGATFDARDGISVPSGNSLTIWAQSTGKNMGKLNAIKHSDGNLNNLKPAIGSNSFEYGGNITVNGGFIYADGSQYDQHTDASGGDGINGYKVTIRCCAWGRGCCWASFPRRCPSWSAS